MVAVAGGISVGTPTASTGTGTRTSETDSESADPVEGSKAPVN